MGAQLGESRQSGGSSPQLSPRPALGSRGSCAQAVALLEELLLSRKVADKETWQEPLQQWALGPLVVKEEPLDFVEGEISKEPAERFRDSREESLDPQLGLALLPVKKEETFLPDPVQSLRLLAQDLGRWLEGNSWLLLVTCDESCVLYGSHLCFFSPRNDGKGSQLTQEKVLVTAEMREERCESKNRQGTDPLMESKGSGLLAEGLGAAYNNPSPVDTEKEETSFSKNSGRNPSHKSDAIFEHSGAVCNEGPLWGEKIKPELKLAQEYLQASSSCRSFATIIHTALPPGPA
ncbi:hypothetical protein lerEdw1_011199 [Lerista edwardsae]|nr:hypothetical protein lerEdw1_011199 [Lerista edwardsae]